jgi:hypothetical protein
MADVDVKTTGTDNITSDKRTSSEAATAMTAFFMNFSLLLSLSLPLPAIPLRRRLPV